MWGSRSGPHPSGRVGPPRVGSRDDFAKWVCRLDNFVNDASADCEAATAGTADDSATADAKRSVDGPWDALIYAKDPIALAVVTFSILLICFIINKPHISPRDSADDAG